MPRFNGTGPMGFGPGTGWGKGPCGGGQFFGRRNGRQGQGLGQRRFWGHYPASALDEKEEIKMLSDEENILKEELEAIKSRLTQLKSAKN
ncbi:MAG: DUF5320 domain-containing protein [Patescibacteria group bacterium]|nr:DUF5320 domain-containing protein [Patescibacteria group bacterium]MDD5173116.1 DUF5320 domain-containing protein [Patescibacteria group bacterium]